MIFCLSFTGNTLWAARQMAEVTNDRIVSISDAVKGPNTYTLKEGERVGFLFPVHGWRLQPMVAEFISSLKLVNANHNTYYYALLTAGDSAGEVVDQLEDKLRLKDIKLNIKNVILMPESYVGLPFMDVDSDLREAEKKSFASIELRKFSELVLYRRSIALKYNRGYAPGIYTKVFGRFFHKFLVKDKFFKVNADKCISCGKCGKVCQVDNIDLAQGYPAWKSSGNCLTCLACYHYCPERAIEFGWFTKGKGQYYFEHNRKANKL